MFDEKEYGCNGCIWNEDCDYDVRCDNYTPSDDTDDVEYYMNDLSIRAQIYEGLVDEQQD